MDRGKEIEELKLIIEENMARCSNAEMPYVEALKMCALGILASGFSKTEEILQDVKSTLAIAMVHGRYFDDWQCSKVIEFIDKVMDPIKKKYCAEVDE